MAKRFSVAALAYYILSCEACPAPRCHGTCEPCSPIIGWNDAVWRSAPNDVSASEGERLMAGEGKVDVEILYCVPGGHLGMVAWMVNEFYAEGGRDISLTLTPGTQDVLQVYVDGTKIYDKQ